MLTEILINRLSVKKTYDSLTISSLDSLFKAKVSLKRNYPSSFFEWKEVYRTGYSFHIEPEDSIVLIVTGKLTAAYTSFWGLGEIGSMVWYKHPWANKTKPKEIQFEYLLEPISAWNSVGSIQVSFTYPKNWNLRSNIVNVPKGFGLYMQNIKETMDEDSGYVTFQRTLKKVFLKDLYSRIQKSVNMYFQVVLNWDLVVREVMVLPFIIAGKLQLI